MSKNKKLCNHPNLNKLYCKINQHGIKLNQCLSSIEEIKVRVEKLENKKKKLIKCGGVKKPKTTIGDAMNLLIEFRKEVKEEINELRTEVKEIRFDVNQLKSEVKEIRSDVNQLKSDVNELKKDVSVLKQQVNKLNKAVFS